MSKDYFPFKVGDKLKSPNAYRIGNSNSRNTYKGPLGEERATDEFMEITAIGRTMFLAAYDSNEHLLSKAGSYELYND